MTALPSVGVVLPTHNRPALLRGALAAVLAQDYAGELTAVVVFDRAEPDLSLADLDPAGRVRVMVNERTPGLPGARNTGILALDTDLVAFCDDDDEWLPGKLTAQVAALEAEPAAQFASCGIVVEFRGEQNPRLAGKDRIEHADLVRSRMVMVHSSTYLARRAALLDAETGIGLVDETIPAGQNEDWDLALRAARRHPIVNVDRPLVRVLWGRTSLFAGEYATKIAGLEWMLAHHPELAADPVGAARVYGQIAFWSAGLGRRRAAVRWAGRAVRANWRERRVPFALAVAAGVVSDERVLRGLHARGHGI
ncbi:MAG TPA: glycosyltransferase [Thermomonospora sp.]|nr:glycosyltransferase [Thermomonospora sp.]